MQSTNISGDQTSCSPAQLFITMLNGHYEPAQKLSFLYKQQCERLSKNTAFILLINLLYQ